MGVPFADGNASWNAPCWPIEKRLCRAVADIDGLATPKWAGGLRVPFGQVLRAWIGQGFKVTKRGGAPSGSGNGNALK